MNRAEKRALVARVRLLKRAARWDAGRPKAPSKRKR